LELFEINAICQWCVGSAIVMTLIAICSTIRVLRAPDDFASASVEDDLRPHVGDPESEPV
jgi:uncharacterized membrane protein